MTYPIAEIFHSLQGEGVHTGTPMLFVRLAGCNVGEYCATPEPTVILSTPQSDLKLLATTKHSICTSATGERFICDTDYHSYEKHSVEELVKMLAGEEHVCITGGEPFLHNLTPLVLTFQKFGVMVHIETSGTKPIQFLHNDTVDFSGSLCKELLWVTCAPKKGILPGIFDIVDEVKLLVGPGTRKEDLLDLMVQISGRLEGRVFLSPINGIDECRDDSLDLCLRLLRELPSLRLSAQLHKYIGQR